MSPIQRRVPIQKGKTPADPRDDPETAAVDEDDTRKLKRWGLCSLSALSFFLTGFLFLFSYLVTPGIKRNVRKKIPINDAAQEMRSSNIVSASSQQPSGKSFMNVDMYNGRTDCFIFTDGDGGFEWFGSGRQGQVWKAILDCGGRNESVTVKSVGGKYAQSSGPSQWRELYNAVMLNSTEAEMRKRFAIPIGTLQIPPNKRLPGMKKPPKSVIAASVSYLAPGKKLIDEFPDGHIGPIEKRRQIVRQMIGMFAHLMDRGILYCDMKTGMQHLFHSVASGETVLIDFDNIMILDSIDNNYYRAHAVEILSLLAMVCLGQISRNNPHFQVDTSQFCSSTPPSMKSLSPQHRERLVSALDKCEFDQSTDWVGDWEHVEKARDKFKSLMKWSGNTN